MTRRGRQREEPEEQPVQSAERIEADDEKEEEEPQEKEQEQPVQSAEQRVGEGPDGEEEEGSRVDNDGRGGTGGLVSKVAGGFLMLLAAAALAVGIYGYIAIGRAEDSRTAEREAAAEALKGTTEAFSNANERMVGAFEEALDQSAETQEVLAGELRTNVAAAKDSSQRVEAQLQGLVGEVSAIEEALSSLQTQQTQETMESLQQDLQNLKSSVEGLAGRLEESNGALEERLSTAIRQVKERVEALAQEVGQFQSSAQTTARPNLAPEVLTPVADGIGRQALFTFLVTLSNAEAEKEQVVLQVQNITGAHPSCPGGRSPLELGGFSRTCLVSRQEAEEWVQGLYNPNHLPVFPDKALDYFVESEKSWGVFQETFAKIQGTAWPPESNALAPLFLVELERPDTQNRMIIVRIRFRATGTEWPRPTCPGTQPTGKAEETCLISEQDILPWLQNWAHVSEMPQAGIAYAVYPGIWPVEP